MPRLIPACAAILAATFVVTGCGSDSTTITLTGSSTVSPVMTDIGQLFEAQHPHVRVDVHSGGSSRGIADLRKGTNDLAMISRDLGAEEQDLHAIPLAYDGVTVILHADNPVAALTDEQIRAIYTGQITDWSTVGGPAEPIVVVHKAAGRATRVVFCQHFGLDEAAVQASVVIGDNAEGIKAVAGNPRAIGYVSIGAAEYEQRTGAPLKLLPLAGVPATTAELAAGRFPAKRTLYLVGTAEPTGPVKDLVDLATSAQVDDIIRRHFFVPVAR